MMIPAEFSMALRRAGIYAKYLHAAPRKLVPVVAQLAKLFPSAGRLVYGIEHKHNGGTAFPAGEMNQIPGVVSQGKIGSFRSHRKQAGEEGEHGTDHGPMLTCTVFDCRPFIESTTFCLPGGTLSGTCTFT